MGSTHRTLAFACAIAIGSATHAQAQMVAPIKPGLWEYRHRGTVDGQDNSTPAEQVARMPEGKRAQALRDFAAHDIPLDGFYVTRRCITPQMITANQWFSGGGREGCTATYGARNWMSWNWRLSCPGADNDVQVSFNGTESFDATTVHTSSRGTTVFRYEDHAKRLGADCAGAN